MNEKIKEKFKFSLHNKTLVMIDWANVHGWFSDPESKSYLGWVINPKRLFDCLSTYKEIIGKRLYHGVEVGNKRSEDFGANVETIGFTFIKKEVKWVPVYLNAQNHFKRVVQNLFNVLDGIKTTNSAIANKLYELREKIKKDIVQGRDFIKDKQGEPQEYALVSKVDMQINEYVYGFVEELDVELKKLNINIDDLQKNLLEPVKRRKCDFDVEIASDVCNLSNDFKTLILFSGDGDYAALADDLISKGKKVILVFAPGHKGKEYESLQEKLKETGKNYALFVCTVNNLKEDLCVQNNQPTDFSVG